MNKYILFSTDVDWRYISWEKPILEQKIDYYSDTPYIGLEILKKTIRFFYSWTINKKIRVPFRRILYKGILKGLNIKESDNVKIIFYDRSRVSYDFSFIDFLRKQIPNVKIGYLFSDIVDKSGANTLGIVNSLNEHYDKVFSFDKYDAKKYNFDYSYLIYERPQMDTSIEIESDVFLVAQAKDRLLELLEVYDKCAEEGLTMDFAINNIADSELKRVEDRNIQINEIIPYNEVVERLWKSKCIVDIMQKGSVGITLNVVEAVVYNKKIISNNKELVNEPFYDSSRILILNEKSNITEFLNEPMKPYTEEDRHIFSGIKLFERL